MEGKKEFEIYNTLDSHTSEGLAKILYDFWTPNYYLLRKDVKEDVCYLLNEQGKVLLRVQSNIYQMAYRHPYIYIDFCDDEVGYGNSYNSDTLIYNVETGECTEENVYTCDIYKMFCMEEYELIAEGDEILYVQQGKVLYRKPRDQFGTRNLGSDRIVGNYLIINSVPKLGRIAVNVTTLEKQIIPGKPKYDTITGNRFLCEDELGTFIYDLDTKEKTYVDKDVVAIA